MPTVDKRTPRRIMNALTVLLAALAGVLTVTGPDGAWLVCWGALLALAGWRTFVAYYGDAIGDD